MKKTLVSLAVLATLSANANDEHNHANHIGAHEHGTATLNLVVEGDELKVMLETPAMNVMGFEYEPKSEADLNTSHEALHHLKDGEWVVVNGSECQYHEGNVQWKYKPILQAHFHDKDGEMKGDTHNHDHAEHKHEHEEAEHKQDHAEHKHEHNVHDHAHKAGETHSDVSVSLDFDCATPAEISSVTIELFEKYAGFEKLNVQWIAGDKQGATTLTKDSHEIHFK